MEHRPNMLTHGRGHSFLIVSVGRIYVEHRNAPSVFLGRIQPHIIVFSRQAFALSFDRKVVRNLLSHTLAPVVAKLWNEKSLLINFLAAVAIKTIAAQEIFVKVTRIRSIYILRNGKPRGPANWLALSRTQTGDKYSGTLDCEMVH